MSHDSHRRLFPAAAALAALALASGLGMAQARPGPWESWGTLRMRVRAMPLMSGSLELERSADGGRQRLESRAQARFLGATLARSRSVSVLDRASGIPREHLSLSKDRGRRYVFGARDYTVEKFRSPGGPDAPAAQWERGDEKRHAYPLRSGKPVPVFDSWSMLLRLSREKLERTGDEVTLHVATSRGPEAYRIRVTDARTSQRTFTDLGGGAKRTLDVRELRLAVIPADPESDEGFIGMKGETEVWVEAQTKTPLEIGGRVPKVGKVVLELSELG